MQGPPCMCQLSHVLVNSRCEASNAFLSLSIIRSKIEFHLFQPHHPTHARLCISTIGSSQLLHEVMPSVLPATPWISPLLCKGRCCSHPVLAPLKLPSLTCCAENPPSLSLLMTEVEQINIQPSLGGFGECDRFLLC